MTLQESIDALTAQTTALLQSSVTLKNGVSQQIADAVTISKNAAINPLIIMATNSINTQTMIVNYIITN